MSGRVFLDTNVLVYVFDADESRKQEIARQVLGEAARQPGYALSTQVLQEFYVSVTRKLARPLAAPLALKATRDLARLHVVQIDVSAVVSAIRLSQRRSLSFWDALIVESARQADCRTLLTEDLQNGLRIGRVTVRNPFL